LAGGLMLCLGAGTASVARAETPRTPPSTRVVTAEQRRARTHLREGQRLMSAESFAEAAREFGLAVHLDPLLVMAHYGLGQARMALKEFPAAVEAYLGCREAFAKLEAANTDERLAVGRSRDDQIRDLRDAVFESEAALRGLAPGSRAAAAINARIQRLQLQIDSLDKLRGQEFEGTEEGAPPSLLLALGSAYFRAGQVQDAEREYKAAIARRPKFGEAHSNLAVIYLETGRPADAKQEVKLAEKSGFRVHADLKKEIDKALEGR
jgi:tetratricopeptide (TPR) repeat protein